MDLHRQLAEAYVMLTQQVSAPMTGCGWLFSDDVWDALEEHERCGVAGIDRSRTRRDIALSQSV